MRFTFLIFLVFSFSLKLFSMNIENDNHFLYSDISMILDDTVRNQKYFIVNDIKITGNKVTKEHIIYRELLFQKNDTIESKKLGIILEKSRENLLNTSLFNFVTINTINLSENNIKIRINVLERWYLWPFPIFEFSDRNFNSWWQKKDLSRLNYGMYIIKKNFRGREEILKLRLTTGYDDEYGIYYHVPYINKKQTIGLAYIFSYITEHEVNYMTLNNKLKFFKNKEHYLQKGIFSRIQLTERRKIHNIHKLRIEYNYFNFNDTLMRLNENFTLNDKSIVQYFSLYYQYKSDFRDFKPYPLKGHYFDISLTKNGLGFFNNNGINILYLESTFRKFWKIHNRFYFASGINGKITTKKFQPYFIQRALGYERDFVRSYEYYVIDGQSFALLKTDFKYELLHKRITKLNFIPTDKFNTIHYAIYMNLFADAGYVYDDQFYKDNSLANQLLFGTGFGIDIVTYYDLVLRLEYSINKMGETGFFIHFTAPI